MKTIYQFSLILITLSIIWSCSNVEVPNLNFFQLASAAEDRQDYSQAKHYYQKILANSHKHKASPTEVSAATYNLGRINGYLCNYTVAETLLLQSLHLEEALSGPDSETSSMNIFELARLYYDQDKYDEALPYYKKGIIILEKLSIQDSDPIAFADVIDEFAQTLKETNNLEQANASLQQAKKLRTDHPNKSATFKPQRYGKDCQQN